MSTQPRILIIEDEPSIVDTLTLNLEEEGFEVVSTGRGDAGLRLALAQPFDLVILDLMLPGRDGREVCQAIRKRSQVAILMLTARARETDKVAGLEIGADDYVTKPFGLLELLARVKALIRRSRVQPDDAYSEPEESYSQRGVTLNVARHRVEVDGEVVELRPKEFELLKALIRTPGRVLQRDRILELVWGEDEYLDRGTLDVHVRWLRQKIEQEPSRPERILTVRGVGYKFSDGTE
jgi:two-component system response regulator RegX3